MPSVENNELIIKRSNDWKR